MRTEASQILAEAENPTGDEEELNIFAVPATKPGPAEASKSAAAAGNLADDPASSESHSSEDSPSEEESAQLDNPPSEARCDHIQASYTKIMMKNNKV